MRSDQPRMAVDFRQHLARQLDFLRASAAAYDAGYRDEAYRIAVVLRVLIHQTRTSTSLLRHLGAESVPLLSTTEPASPTAIFYDGLSLIAVQGGSGDVTVGPALDQAHTRGFVAALDWWTEELFVLNTTRLSRKNIVLSAANQDGGAHVDAQLDLQYAEFKQGIWSGPQDPSVTYDIPEPQLVFLRQMAYEILNSPSLGDLVANGTVSPQNLGLTAPTPPWEPEKVAQADLDAMPLSEVERLRNVVRKGHFTLLDGLYRSSPGGATNPLGNYQIDQGAGYVGSIEDWIKAIMDEDLIAASTSAPGLYTGTKRGQAFVARIIEIGR